VVANLTIQTEESMASSAAFNIKDKATDTLYKKCLCGCGETLDTAPLYASAEEALKYIKIMKLDGYIPTVYIDESWKKREIQKFTNGQYQPLVWQDEKWYIESKERIFDKFFPHVSMKDTTIIAFTESPEKGMQDVQTPIKPGKFLQRFFGKVLTPEEITLWANKHTEAWADVLKLKFAETPEDIVKVYEMDSGFTSCMQKPINHFEPLLNPTRIYAKGLKLGYILDSKGKLIARALVWPEKKKVGRIYGDDFRFRAAVKEKLGFDTQSNNSNYDKFYGAELEAIEFENGYIGPYIDGDARAYMHKDKLGNKKLVLADSSGRDSDANYLTEGAHTLLATPHCQHGLLQDGSNYIKKCARCGTPLKYTYHKVLFKVNKYDRYCQNCMESYCRTYKKKDGLTLKYDNSVSENYRIAVYDQSTGRYASSIIDIGPMLDPEDYGQDLFGGYFLPKADSIVVNNHSLIPEWAYKKLSRAGSVYKSDLDGKYYSSTGGINFNMVLVSGEKWTVAQAEKFADYNIEQDCYVRNQAKLSQSDNLFQESEQR
jgi:hypothetical protein